ncbi:MAG TPA: immune inhibitor A [Chloroflexota bacterium]|nr:immune inhibitor A [Chloroflexota bacterium]
MMNETIRIVPPSDPEPNKSRWLLWLAGGCLFMLLCLGCVGVVGLGGGYYAYTQFREELSANVTATETAQHVNGRATPPPDDTAVPTPPPSPTSPVTNIPADTPLPPPETPTAEETAVAAITLPVPTQINQIPLPPRAGQDLQQLYITNFPAHDYYDTAVRLNNYSGPRTITTDTYQPGDGRTFSIDGDRIQATLAAVTDNTYFWVAEDTNLNTADVAAAASRFESDYYQPLVNLFGPVWQPGVDNDPRFSVLHLNSSAADELGFFRGEDEYPRTIAPNSNEQEIIYLNMGELEMGEDLYYATLVHEVQHLIQWNMDPGEAAWMNEGLSQLAEIALGFTDTAETIDYLENPATPLNSWNYDDDVIYAHYAGAYLFLVYVWEQLGETAVQELARHPATGMAGVYAILQGFAPDITLEQFTAHWAAANYLDNGSNAVLPTDGRFHYQNLTLRRPSLHQKPAANQPYDAVDKLPQFGVHYIDLRDWRGPVTISFAGDTAVPLIDANLAQTADNFFWYAPAVDEMNARLTGLYDLSGVDQATLTYSTWYDLEEEYDYAYLSISTDGGQTWQTLTPEHSSRGTRGRGYNGRSAAKPGAQNGWLKESISLNAFTGQPIQLRVDVITDSGITGQGFAIDDIHVTGHQAASFTDGPENWQAEGFILTGGWLPQRWSVLLIEEKIEGQSDPRVTPLALDALNQGQWVVEIGKGGGVLMIMPQTPFANNEANYWLNVRQ